MIRTPNRHRRTLSRRRGGLFRPLLEQLEARLPPGDAFVSLLTAAAGSGPPLAADGG